jgi:hypothetical protein
VSDGWWNDNEAAGDYQYAQTSETQNQLDPNTTYSPPGDAAPIDQYNYVPDPNAPGGYQTYPPGQVAPIDATAFSNTSGQYPNDASMANAIGNNIDLTPTVTADGSAGFGGFQGLPQNEQQTWIDTYGPNAAQYIWAQQSGNMGAAPEGFNALPKDQQNIWYGTYGEYAPQIWQQQSQAAAGGGFLPSPQPDTWAQYNNLIYGPQNNWYDPATGRHTGWGSIGAGTQWTAPGWGVPGFNQEAVQINPELWNQMQNQQWMQQFMPGYIPGSGTYNQYRLDQEGLLTSILGQPVNARYGQGGTGDPTTGLEPQTPQEWLNGPRAFGWDFNMGQTDATRGMDYLANLFGRPDAGSSGISTAAWSAPQQYWAGLADAVQKGIVKASPFGLKALASKGFNVTPPGGPVDLGGSGRTAPGAGPGGTGPMGPGTQAFNYQAAYLDYLSARMNQLEIPGMNQLNQREQDKLAFERAKQSWLEQYQAAQQAEAQRQFNLLQGVREGQLTGTYGGQQTLAAKAQEQQTSLGYLNLLAQLRGPGDIFQYLKVLNGTPGGIRDVVNAAAGAYRMPNTGGGNVTVGGYSNPSDLNTLLGQINNPDFGAEGKNLNLPLPNQINALALQRMTPSQQQSLLGAYEAAGYNPQDVLSIFQNSLPQYSYQGQAGRVGLFR